MDTKQLFSLSTKKFFRPYHFPSNNSLSGHGLTGQGLAEYLEFIKEQEPSIYKDTVAHINYNPDCTPKFDKKFLDDLGQSLSNQKGRGMHIIYRGNHTVSLLNEDNNFLLLDSYNAFPAADADHLPLLGFVRQSFPQSKIFTLHDKMQNDYHNCAFFATQGAGAIERALQNQNLTLADFIKNLDTQKVHTPSPDCANDALKIQEYERLGIETVPTPPQLVPFVQSLTLAGRITQGSKSFREFHPWLRYGSYANELGNFSLDERRNGGNKLTKMNVNMAVKNDVFRFAVLDGHTPSTRDNIN